MEKDNFNKVCGICGNEWTKPQYPEEESSQPGVTRVIICDPCYQKFEKQQTGGEMDMV